MHLPAQQLHDGPAQVLPALHKGTLQVSVVYVVSVQGL